MKNNFVLTCKQACKAINNGVECAPMHQLFPHGDLCSCETFSLYNMNSILYIAWGGKPFNEWGLT